MFFGGSAGALATVFAAASLAWACTPQAFLVLSPNAGPAGTSRTATSAAFSDSPVELRWGSSSGPVLATGSGPSFSASFTVPSAAPGYYTVVAQTADGQGRALAQFRITPSPTASFTATPKPAKTGQRVNFNGSASTDPDGTIAKYDWDLDGDGSYETDTAATSTTSRVYSTAGVRTVKLRVTDNDGGTGETTLPLRIDAPASVVTPVLAPALVPPALPTSFAASRKAITVSKSGRFRYSFLAEPGLTGKINLRSIKRAGAARRISLGTKSYTVPASGIVKVSWKLSRRNLRILERSKRIRFRVAVTLGNAAGLSRTGATTLTLKKPAP